MQLRNAQAGSTEGVERCAAIIKLEGKVAGVVIDTDTFFDELGIGAEMQQTLKKRDGFLCVFKMAKRLGF